MKFDDAKKLGIEIIYEYGKPIFVIPCDTCGASIKLRRYYEKKRHICAVCRQKEIAEKNKPKENAQIEKNRDKKERQFARAVKFIKSPKEYAQSIEEIKNKLHTYGWFDSSTEILAAIELTKASVEFEHQYKVSVFKNTKKDFGHRTYRVDFVLPKLKVALEIDGSIYHSDYNPKRESPRDYLIRKQLGAGWNVIHIPAEMIEKKPSKLMEAIIAILAQRKTRKNY